LPQKLDVPQHLQRSVRKDEAAAQRSALALLTDLAARLDRHDLADIEVLDVGCGVKFTQAILNNDLAIGRYVGIDVYEPLVTFLQGSVRDPRFEYHHLDFHNARYNPGGHKMTESSRLPLDERTFDVICAYSLFTHLEPSDFRTMLVLLRRHAAAATRLCYTAFLNELTAGGHGLMDTYTGIFGESVLEQAGGYRDFTPDDPLRQTLYTREYVYELTDGTGWFIEDIADPTPYAQHLLTLRPA
jgi:SAM-dependent methyltransferase